MMGITTAQARALSRIKRRGVVPPTPHGIHANTMRALRVRELVAPRLLPGGGVAYYEITAAGKEALKEYVKENGRVE